MSIGVIGRNKNEQTKFHLIYSQSCKVHTSRGVAYGGGQEPHIFENRGPWVTPPPPPTPEVWIFQYLLIFLLETNKLFCIFQNFTNKMAKIREETKFWGWWVCLLMDPSPN